MAQHNPAGLFGLKHSNRDFSLAADWGKNKFNSSFPASLCCYLASKGEQAVYLTIINGLFGQGEISLSTAFGISPSDEDAYFAFESAHAPFQKYVIGELPRTDLVIQKRSTGDCLAAIEVKLTALPDNRTHSSPDHLYGSEIVVRPDTIGYLACSIAKGLGEDLGKLIPDTLAISDWSDPREILGHMKTIVHSLAEIAIALESNQRAFLLQPIWKTEGKSPQLAVNCLDVFFWSDAGFTHFISEIANVNEEANQVTRQTRTAIWLFKMLFDLKADSRFHLEWIIDNLTYNKKNDKAFASSGDVTNRFMASKRLTTPLITKEEIKNIILGGGQRLLSPERRFDAIISNSPGLFD